MNKLVDYKDVLECLEYAIKAGWTLEEFKDHVENWQDFVEVDEWHSVDEELPTQEGCCTWVAFADGTVDEDSWTGKRGEEAQWATGEKFVESGWWSWCDDHENRITHWKAQTTPRHPKEFNV